MNVCAKAKIGLKKVLYKKYNICNNIDNDYIKQNIMFDIKDYDCSKPRCKPKNIFVPPSNNPCLSC